MFRLFAGFFINWPNDNVTVSLVLFHRCGPVRVHLVPGLTRSGVWTSFQNLNVNELSQDFVNINGQRGSEFLLPFSFDVNKCVDNSISEGSQYRNKL